MNVTVKTVLNNVHPIPGFVYRDLRLSAEPTLHLDVRLTAHAQRAPRCSICERVCPGYDHLPERQWLFVPPWQIPTTWHYAPRRVTCPEHGIVVEAMPWNIGKHPLCKAMMQFLGQWARRLAWKEVGGIFHVSWASVCRSVEWMVAWGLAHRTLTGIQALGIDEIHFGRGKKSAAFLTVIYQIDVQVRRLLWVGKRRTQATLRRGLKALGPEVCQGIKHVCSDMWRPFRQVIARRLPQALHVIDRFHVMLNLNQAVDKVRRQESSAGGSVRAKKLKRMRWSLLRRKSRVRGKARERLEQIIGSRLKTARAYVLKESFGHFWTYRSVTWARNYMHAWITRTLKSRIGPMMKVARTLRSHENLILNWIACRHEIMTGAVEGLNNKIRVVTKRSYGFRTFRVMELAMYHTLGRLPDPPSTHKFW